jgi:hypothetical protein
MEMKTTEEKQNSPVDSCIPTNRLETHHNSLPLFRKRKSIAIILLLELSVI